MGWFAAERGSRRSGAGQCVRGLSEVARWAGTGDGAKVARWAAKGNGGASLSANSRFVRVGMSSGMRSGMRSGMCTGMCMGIRLFRVCAHAS